MVKQKGILFRKALDFAIIHKKHIAYTLLFDIAFLAMLYLCGTASYLLLPDPTSLASVAGGALLAAGLVVGYVLVQTLLYSACKYGVLYNLFMTQKRQHLHIRTIALFFLVNLFTFVFVILTLIFIAGIVTTVQNQEKTSVAMEIIMGIVLLAFYVMLHVLHLRFYETLSLRGALCSFAKDMKRVQQFAGPVIVLAAFLVAYFGSAALINVGFPSFFFEGKGREVFMLLAGLLFMGVIAFNRAYFFTILYHKD